MSCYSQNHAAAMVLEAFGQPLAERQFALPDPEPGAALVEVLAAGVCGSDLDIAAGRDPRIRLPLTLGHEGVGRIVATGGEIADIFGRALQPGDVVVWERGLFCGRCYFCAVAKQPSLCPNRRAYGITIPASEPPHLNGCYATHIYLRPGTRIIRLPEGADLPLVAAAVCSGATAAHAIEQVRVQPGETVVVIGPGPLGLFAAALALSAGAAAVAVLGTRRGRARLEIARRMGCMTLNVDETSPEQRREAVLELSGGLGAQVVIDAAGNARSFAEALNLVAPGGRIALPGVATPIGEVPVPLYEKVVRRGVAVFGTWVSDTRHLWQAVSLALSGRFPLADMITHRFPLREANRALEALERREAIKAVLVADELL